MVESNSEWVQELGGRAAFMAKEEDGARGIFERILCVYRHFASSIMKDVLQSKEHLLNFTTSPYVSTQEAIC